MPRRFLLCLNPFVSICVVLAMLLPSAGIFVPDSVWAQSTPADPATEIPEIVPIPFPQADWPESPAALHPLYPSSTTPLPDPAVNQIDPVANGATLDAATAEQAITPVVDTEAGKTGVVTGAVQVALTADLTFARLGNLQLQVARTATTAQAVTVQAEVLAAAEANALSPVGMAFKLTVTGTDEATDSNATRALQVTLDYSQIPLRYGGSFADRLTLYRVTPCAKGITALAKEEAAPAESCRVWQPLRGDNDRANQQLTVVVTPTLVSSAVATLCLKAPRPSSSIYRSSAKPVSVSRLLRRPKRHLSKLMSFTS